MRPSEHLSFLTAIYLLITLDVVVGAEDFEVSIAVLQDESQTVEKRIEAAKACMDDGPLDPRVLSVLAANMDFRRVPASREYFYLDEDRDYRYPYWRLLVDKIEGMPTMVDAALNNPDGTTLRTLGVWGIVEQKRRGFDAAGLLEKAISETSDEAVARRAKALIGEIGHHRPLDEPPIPQYKKPPPQPNPPRRLPPWDHEVAKSNPDVPETGTQPPPSAQAPASAERPLASAGMSGRPWLLAGGGVAVILFVAAFAGRKKLS